MRQHFTLCRMAAIKIDNNKCCLECRKIVTFIHCWWECKMTWTDEPTLTCHRHPESRVYLRVHSRGPWCHMSHGFGQMWLDPWVRKIPWRRKWQPTSLFLPGKSHGQRSLVDYCRWGHKESDSIEHAHADTHT